jgi:argininosuccinate lyase
MVQYASPRPWPLLKEGEGSTYVSSAMPQKATPGLLNSTRRDASTAVSLAIGPILRSHNLPPGMADAKEVRDNSAMVRSAIGVLANWNKILNLLVVSPERALEELNSDWTASQELADLLMRKYKLPFRVGHHFASEVVDYGRDHDIKPSAFPYAEARRIYASAVKDAGLSVELPMSEAEFRGALDPTHIVNARATVGGPQPAEMERMLGVARGRIAEQKEWIAAHRKRIDQSLAKLDADFDRLVRDGPR